MLLSNVEPETWYRVNDVAKILGWSEDVVRRWVDKGLMQAFVKPVTSTKRKRVWMGLRIQGAEIIRFVEANLTTLSGKSLRIRIG
jgi:hypothetical protein